MKCCHQTTSDTRPEEGLWKEAVLPIPNLKQSMGIVWGQTSQPGRSDRRRTSLEASGFRTELSCNLDTFRPGLDLNWQQPAASEALGLACRTSFPGGSGEGGGRRAGPQGWPPTTSTWVSHHLPLPKLMFYVWFCYQVWTSTTYQIPGLAFRPGTRSPLALSALPTRRFSWPQGGSQAVWGWEFVPQETLTPIGKD